MKHTLYAFLTVLLLGSCQKETITLSTNASDVFYLLHKGAAMRVQVDGNTASKVFVVLVHGGPGATSFVYNTDFITQNLEGKLAVVYWDQRNAGASQGGANGKYLHLKQNVEDLKKLIELIRYRYGQDIRVYLLGHSWGGLVTAGFLTEGSNQDMVRGWICVDGSHNYPLNDTLTHDKLLSVGLDQVSQGKHASDWNDIISYCRSHTGPYSFDESMTMESFAETAETLMDSVVQVNFVSVLSHMMIKQDIPLTSLAMNYLYTTHATINEEISTADYSAHLTRVTIPVLLLYGKFDFICPEGMADDILAHIGSSYTRKVISPVSGHNFMLQDPGLFVTEVLAFIDANP